MSMIIHTLHKAHQEYRRAFERLQENRRLQKPGRADKEVLDSFDRAAHILAAAYDEYVKYEELLRNPPPPEAEEQEAG
jgi:hypothetical protein